MTIQRRCRILRRMLEVQFANLRTEPRYPNLKINKLMREPDEGLRVIP